MLQLKKGPGNGMSCLVAAGRCVSRGMGKEKCMGATVACGIYLVLCFIFLWINKYVITV